MSKVATPLTPSKIGIIRHVNTPRILVEYLKDGKVFNRNIELRKVNVSESVEKMARVLVKKHSDLLERVEFGQVVKIVKILLEKKEVEKDSKKEVEKVADKRAEKEVEKEKTVATVKPVGQTPLSPSSFFKEPAVAVASSTIALKPTTSGQMNYESDEYSSDDSFEDDETPEVDSIKTETDEDTEKEDGPATRQSTTNQTTLIKPPKDIKAIEQSNNNKLDSLLNARRGSATQAQSQSQANTATKKTLIVTQKPTDEKTKKYLSSFGDLNKVSEDELSLAKEKMNDAFEKNRAKPGDNDYVWDKRAEFEEGDEESSWD